MNIYYFINLVIHDQDLSKYLRKASALEKLSVAAIFHQNSTRDHWQFSAELIQECYSRGV